MKDKKFLFKDAKQLSFLLSLLGFLFFVLACSSKIKGLSIFLGIMAGLSIIGGCVCLYLWHRATFTQQNDFLFDRRRRVKLSSSDITFEFLDDNLTYFLSQYVKNTIDLWNGIPKNLEMALQATPAYRTPVAFKMLYDMSSLGEAEIMALFEASQKQTVAFVCRAVKQGGDKEMADVIFELKCDLQRLSNRIVPFFKKNKRCFEGRLYHYIKGHLSEFDKDKK